LITTERKADMSELIPQHGGYRKLKSFQVADSGQLKSPT
jgi:hypothetical protein